MLASKPTQNSTATPESLFWLNVFALSFVDLGLSIWLLYYTSIFPEVAGVLALGGALSWIVFVLQLLTEIRCQTGLVLFENTGLLVFS